VENRAAPVLDKPVGESQAQLSPDGRWLLYQQRDSTGTSEIYVQPYPPTGRVFQIDQGGGTQPTWSRDGREIFYLSSDGRLMVVACDTKDAFRRDAPASLFAGFTLGGGTGRQYDVSADGRRFLIHVAPEAAQDRSLTVVVNWPATIQSRLP
jgi:Tol biopolymer transport system component